MAAPDAGTLDAAAVLKRLRDVLGRLETAQRLGLSLPSIDYAVGRLGPLVEEVERAQRPPTREVQVLSLRVAVQPDSTTGDVFDGLELWCQQHPEHVLDWDWRIMATFDAEAVTRRVRVPFPYVRGSAFAAPEGAGDANTDC